MTAEFVIGEQEAQDQIDQFCEWYGIDLQESLSMASDEGAAAIELTLKRLNKAFRRGDLEVREEEHKKLGTTLILLQRLSRPVGESQQSEIKYHELTGASKASVKIGKNANETEALFATLSVLAKEPRELFKLLRGRDLGVANLAGVLFLMV